MALPAVLGCALLMRGKAEERDDRLRAEWTALLPWMQAGHLKLIQWADYREQRLGLNIDRRPTEVIIKELEESLGERLVE